MNTSKDEVIKNALGTVTYIPKELMSKLRESIPQMTTEKAHAYPASLLHALKTIDENIIKWDKIKNKYARVYVNLPWCKTKCIYCRYPESIKIPDENEISAYFADLKKEFIIYKDRLKAKKIPAETLYIGGGTPTLLSATQLDRLFTLIDENITFENNTHKIIEASPSTINKEKIDVIKKHNFNRVSLGVQSLNENVLKKCLRKEEGLAKVKKAIAIIKNAEIPQLNIDIMLGLPGQTLKIFIDDLYKVIKMAPTAVSFLDMEIWPGAELFEQSDYLDEKRMNEQLLMTSAYQQIMEEHNYFPKRAHYYVTAEEMRLPNRKAYFDTRIDGFQIGLGARALSHINNVVYRNVVLEKYHQTIEKGFLPIECGLAMDEEQVTAMRAIRGLCETGIFPKSTRGSFKNELELLIKNNLIDKDYKFTKLGRLLESEIMYLLYPKSQ